MDHVIYQEKNVKIVFFLSYRVFIEYCVFYEDIKIFRTLVFLCFPSSVLVCVHTTGRKNTSVAAELVEFRNIKKI